METDLAAALLSNYCASQGTNTFEGMNTLEIDAEWLQKQRSAVQLLIQEAQARGLTVELIDPETNLYRFTGKQHSALLNTHATLNSYVAVQLLNNKSATKRVLQQAGLRVPEGKEYQSVAEASTAFLEFSPQAVRSGVVIKPKDGRYGGGITFLDGASTQGEWTKAFSYALENDDGRDKAVLVEEFVPGKDTRFLVIGHRVVAIAHRSPSNVVGDGQRTVRDLVAIKNIQRQQFMHGPLELNDVALCELKKQGLTFESVLPVGQTAYLGRTSNLIAGADSMDVTDSVHAGYCELAVRASHAVSAPVVGLDFQILDPALPPTPNNYAILEGNAAPGYNVHQHPTIGTGRNVVGAILDLYGF